MNANRLTEVSFPKNMAECKKNQKQKNKTKQNKINLKIEIKITYISKDINSEVVILAKVQNMFLESKHVMNYR